MRGRRRGVSLIELVMVMSSITALLLLGAGVIHALMRLDRQGREALAEAGTLGRLARQFRRDVHAADRARLVGPEAAAAAEQSLELRIAGDEAVRYAPGRSGVVRTRSRGEKVLGREEYRLALRGAPLLELREEKGATYAVLRLRGREGDPRRLGRRALRFEALVARDHEPAVSEEAR